MAKSVKRKKRKVSSPNVEDSAIPEQAIQTAGRRALSGWPMIVGWLAMLIFAFQACTHMVAAGDTWVAMASGRHFVNHGVDTVEPFSANSHKPGPTEAEIKTWPGWAQWIAGKVGINTVKYWHPTGWINQNWLTHVIFYLLVPKSSYADGVTFSSNALVYWKFAIYILAVICVYYTGRLLGANPALSAIFASFAMFTGRSFIDIRPAGFSNLLVAVFLLILVLATYRNILYMWLIVPLTVFWCNVHGGYIYVFIMLVPFLVLHLLTALPRRWTVSAGSIFLWLGLYAFAYRFRAELHGKIVDLGSNLSAAPVPPYSDKLFYFIAALIVVGLIITARRKVKDVASYGFHIATSVVVVPALLIVMSMAKIPSNLPVEQRAILDNYYYSNLMGFLLVFAALAGLIVVTALLKDRLISVGLRGICHTVAAGFVAFIAVILFNPFHLTNLTHTFVISVSKHAARWRDIHEWRSAFDWSNRVGTSFPFVVLCILSVGLLVLWLFSRFLEPRLLKASRNELKMQKRMYLKLSAVFVYATAVLACWVTFVSFSLLGLDFVSLFLCAVFVAIILLSIYKNVNFIYLAILLSLLAVWSGNPSIGYNGRYFYPFVILPVYVVLYMLASTFSRPIKYKSENIVFVTLAALASLILMMVIFNPFKFEQPVWNVGQFFDLRRIWRPVYERNVGLSYLYLFDTLFILNMVSIIFWLVFPYLKEVFGRTQDEPKKEKEPEGTMYQLPRIDLAIITIAALTIYMAIRSRRFIPIAAIAACPIVAMFIDQIARAISASRNFYAHNRLIVSPMTRNLQLSFIGAGAVAVLFFGTWWGLKFKQVYLDPWPSDPKLSSVFMRMTASDAKPFYAMKFIRDNKLKGKMFNYWTEGGFIAWGQDPDPKTGKTPLQLFMDGRAQAAYDIKTFDIWTYIMAGGLRGSVGYEIMQAAGMRAASSGENLGQILTPDDYTKIGKSMSDELEKRGVWVVLMPAAVYNDPDKPSSYYAIKAFEQNPNWPIVFFNNRQKLYVDVRTPQGRELFDGISNGKTIYPDDYHLNLIRAHTWFYYKRGIEAKKEALDFAITAFNLNPMPSTVIEILLMGTNFSELSSKVNQFCSDYFAEFSEKKNIWLKQDGYRHKVEAARLVCYHLKKLAQSNKDTKLVNFYAGKELECLHELESIYKNKRW
jgi:hypothetical protein